MGVSSFFLPDYFLFDILALNVCEGVFLQKRDGGDAGQTAPIVKLTPYLNLSYSSQKEKGVFRTFLKKIAKEENEYIHVVKQT